MQRFTTTACVLIMGLASLSPPAQPANAAVRSCAVIKSVRSNLIALQSVVSAIPRLSVKQAKERTDKIKFREVALELGNTKRIVPRDVDDSIARVASSIRHAVDLHARHRTQQYQQMLTVISRDMIATWNRFRAFQRDKRC